MKKFKSFFIIILFLYLIPLLSFAGMKEEILSKYQTDKKVQQIIVVSQTKNSNAKFDMYVKDKSQKYGWKQIVSTTAYIGKNGVGKQKEGDWKSPIGTFNITKAFGIKKNPGTRLKYIPVTESLYACDDDCKYYNQIIDTKKKKHNCKGEHLIDYAPQYNYAMCIDFNSQNIYPNGSNIFIHVKGTKSYTAGCIAIDEDSMKLALQNATKHTKIIIK